jgi:hypothetical protein
LASHLRAHAGFPAPSGSTGRNPNLPDYSDFIVVKVPDLK